MLRTTRAALVSLGVAALAACSADPQGAGESNGFDQTRDEIVNGTFTSDTTSTSSGATVRIGNRRMQPNLPDQGNIFCSGVKVGPRRFVTAAHCNPGFYSQPGEGSRLLITNKGCHPPRVAGDGCSMATGLAEIAVDRYYIHPSFLDVLDLANDLAVIDVLADTPSIPTAVLDGSFLEDGASTTLTSYGCMNPSNVFVNLGRKQFANFTALSFTELAADYPLPGVTATAGELYSRHIVADGVPRGPGFPPTFFVQGCPGDSGGPLFTARGTSIQVVGIASFRNLGIGITPNAQLTSFARVAPAIGWLRAPTIKGRPGSITNVLLDKCLSAFESTTSEASVGLALCDGRAGTRDTQYWTVTGSSSAPGTSIIRNGKSGMCLASTGSGDSPVVQRFCSDVASQQWMVSGGLGTTSRSQLTNRASALPLGFRSNGNRLDQAVNDNTNRQRWFANRP